jgi:hypothetical protein
MLDENVGDAPRRILSDVFENGLSKTPPPDRRSMIE